MNRGIVGGFSALGVLVVTYAGIVVADRDPRDQFEQILRNTKRFHEVVTSHGQKVCEIWRDGEQINTTTFLNGKMVDTLRWNGHDAYLYRRSGEEEYSLIASDPVRFDGGSEPIWLALDTLSIEHFGRYPNMYQHTSTGFPELMSLRMALSSPSKVGSEIRMEHKFSSNIRAEMAFDASGKQLRTVNFHRNGTDFHITFDYPNKFDAKLFMSDPARDRLTCDSRTDAAKVAKALSGPEAKATEGSATAHVVGAFRKVGTREIAILWRGFQQSSVNGSAAVVMRPLPPSSVKGSASDRILFGGDMRSRSMGKFWMRDQGMGGFVMIVESPVGKTIDAKIPVILETPYAKVNDSSGKSHTLSTHKTKLVLVKSIPVTQVFNFDPLIRLSVIKPK